MDGILVGWLRETLKPKLKLSLTWLLLPKFDDKHNQTVFFFIVPVPVDYT